MLLVTGARPCWSRSRCRWARSGVGPCREAVPPSGTVTAVEETTRPWVCVTSSSASVAVTLTLVRPLEATVKAREPLVVSGVLRGGEGDVLRGGPVAAGEREAGA